MTLPHVQSTFCSSRSRDAGEDLFGSANTFGVYLVVEYNAPWTPDKDCGFLDHVFKGASRQQWDAMWDALPEPRLQLIQHRGKSADSDRIHVYIAIPHETNPLLYAFEFDDYTQILDLDLHKMLSGDDYQAHLIEQPLYLVCTHAQYDPCCARHGLPIHKAFSDVTDKSNVWQASHIGGHRFAGTAVLLPHGLYYGRIDRDEVENLVKHYEAGELVLSAYRGRACYDKQEQNADFFLRNESSNLRLDAFRHIETTEHDDSTCTVRFEELGTSNTHAIKMKILLSDWAIPMSCSKEEVESRPVYSLVAYHVTQQ